VKDDDRPPQEKLAELDRAGPRGSAREVDRGELVREVLDNRS